MENSNETIEEKAKKFSKLKLQMKLTELRWKAKEKAVKACNWCKENKETVMAGITVGAPLVFGAIREIAKASRARADERHRELMTYDRRTDCYLELKRPLKPKEQKELAERMEAGESKTAVLLSMGLLKQ